MEAASNVGENMAEAGANVVENMAEGVEKGVEMVKDVAENVAERVEDVIDDGSLPNPLLSTDRGDTDDRVNMRTRDDKDSREIGAVRLSGDSGEDSNGDGNSDSEEEGFTTSIVSVPEVETMKDGIPIQEKIQTATGIATVKN